MTQQVPVLCPHPEARACRNCDAWSRYGETKVGKDIPGGFRVVGLKPLGQCRATTPTITPDAIGDETAAWPVVSADDWCRAFVRYRGERGEAA